MDNEKQIQEALDGLRKGQYSSIRAAAKAHNVSKSTLSRRMNGGKSIAESREDQQNLSIAEEKALLRWVSQMTAAGHPVRHGYIREMAYHMLISRHDDSANPSSLPPYIGDTWVQRFLHRNPQLVTIISCTIEAARLKETTKEAIENWFDQYTEAIAEHKILDENKYNMDETGNSIGAIKGAHVVVDKTLQTKYQAHPGRQEWVTAVECVSAVGQSIPPLIIFKGKNVLSSWVPKEALEKDVHFACSSFGYTNNELGFYWLKDIFEPATREKAAGKPRLLLCDGHESHISSEFVIFCIEHNIYLHLLLPHSSHLLQPLDVGVFGPLKKAISARLDRLLRAGINRLEKGEWVERYLEARDISLTESNIRGGWRGSGLVPLNRTRVTHSLPSVLMRPPTPPPAPSSQDSVFDTVINTGTSPDTTVLRSTNALMRRKTCQNDLNTPARRYVLHLTEMTEGLLAEKKILQCQLDEAKAVIGARKERKKGKRLVLKDTYGLSSMEIARQLKECEITTKSKKAPKGHGKKKELGDCIEVVEAPLEDDEEEEEADGFDD